MLGNCYDCGNRFSCRHFRDGTVACSHFERDAMLDIAKAGAALHAESHHIMRTCPLIEAGCVRRAAS
jgi:hypothetical protein